MEEHSLVLVETIDGDDTEMKRNCDSSILRLIAVAVGCYTGKRTDCSFHLVEKRTDERTTTLDHCGIETAVGLRSRPFHLVFPYSIDFLGCRKQALRMKKIQVLYGDNAVANAGEGHWSTSLAGSDYQCPLRCGIVVSRFCILP